MRKYISLIILISACALSTKAQIFYNDSISQFRQVADSIRKDFDSTPYFSIFKDNYFILGVPVGSKITSANSDVKFQISFAQRLTKSVLPLNSHLFISYSQKCFWNVFQESLPMYDLNFNPAIGLSRLIISKGRTVGKLTLMVEHESNGKDGLDSRSWNRISLATNIFITPLMMVHGKIWIPIIDGENNKDLLDYRGIYESGLQYRSANGRLGFAVIMAKRKGWNFNHNVTLEFNYRLFKNENQYFFIQYYNGYGEGLLDYNVHHSRLRAGIVIKPKFFSDY